MATNRAVCPRQWEAARANVVLLLKLWTYFSSHYGFFFHCFSCKLITLFLP